MGQGQTMALGVGYGEWAVLCLLSPCPPASLAVNLSSPPRNSSVSTPPPWLLSPLSLLQD